MAQVVELPTFVRSTDMRTECWRRYILEKIHAEDLPDAGYFGLGTAIHLAIEKGITEDLTLPEMIQVGRQSMKEFLYYAEMEGKEVRWTKKRTEDSWEQDLARMLQKWWKDVHPSSEERLAPYKLLEWPPKVELILDYTHHGYEGEATRTHTTVDAVFESFDGTFVAIVDWKTGATAKANPVQLWTYETIYRNQFQEGRLIESWFHHADFGKIQRPGTHPGDQAIFDIATETNRQKFKGLYTVTPDWYCGYCRAQAYCPVFNQDNPTDVANLAIKLVDDPDVYYDSNGG